MINERVAMIRAGMTPEEVIAFYAAKEKAEKKRGKAKKSESKQPTSILEIPDLSKSETSLPAPPPVPGKQSLKVSTQHQPSHFKASAARMEPSRMRRSSETEAAIMDMPKPSHYMAVEEASQSSNTDELRSAIRTKTLQRLQSSGGPAPPHYMALEMVSQKKARSSSSRKSLPKDLDNESSTSKSRIIGEKLASIKQNVENDRRRRNGTDLSAELSAFFATNNKAALKAKQQQEAKVLLSIDTNPQPLKEGARRRRVSASQSFGTKAVTDTNREWVVGKAAGVRRSNDGAACERKIDRVRPLRRRHSIEGIEPRTSIRNCKDVISLTKSLESMRRVEDMNIRCSPTKPVESMRRVEDMNTGCSEAPMKQTFRRRHSHHMMFEGHSIEDNKRHALIKRKN